MVKKGFDFFTTTAEIVEKNKKYRRCHCCSLCTTPGFSLCMLICKYRSATFEEFIKHEGLIIYDMF